MKTVAAMFAGLLLSAATFIGGVFLAILFLNIDEPAHHLNTSSSAMLWPTTPVLIDSKQQHYQRLAAVNVANAPGIEQNEKTERDSSSTKAGDQIDRTVTSAILSQQGKEGVFVQTERTIAHEEWCSRRYRSYDEKTDTYRPYGGERRACVSPFSENSLVNADESGQELSDINQAGLLENASYSDVSTMSAHEEHIQACARRYRSYRPEDNTYKPYGSSERRQCF